MAHERLGTLLVACCLIGQAQVRPPNAGTHAQQLKSLSLAQLGEIEVTTQTKEPTEVWNTPAPIYVLTGDDIRRSGVTSIPDALRLIPGVNVARVNGSRNWVVAIRGLGDQYSKYVLVLIDGRSIYTPLFGGVLWTADNVMLEDIDRIEVIRGPGGTIWGANAVNGIINIVTRSARDTQGDLVSGGGGSVDQDTEDLRHGARSGNWSYRADAFGFLRSPEFHIDGQSAYDWSRFAQAGFRADRKLAVDDITVQGDAYWGKFGDAQALSAYNPPSTYISYQSTNVWGGNLLGRWRRNLHSRADLYLQGFWAHDHRIGSNFGENRDTIDLDFLHRFWLTAGQHLSYGFGARLSPSSIIQTVPTITFNPLHKTDSIYSAFVEDDIRLVPDKLSLDLGSKFEHNNYTGFEYQPNGRLLFTPSPTKTLWAAVSRAVRTPDRVDEDVQVDVYVYVPNEPPLFGRISGNHNLVAERLVAFEAGGRALVGRRFYLDLSAFHNAYHDLIAQSGATGGPAPTPPFPSGSILISFNYLNGIHGHTDGAEIAPDFQLASGWKIRAGYSYLHLDLADQPGFTDPLTVSTLHGSSPNSQAFVHSQIDFSTHWEFDPSFRWVSALPAQSVKAYVTADARAAWNPNRSWSFSVSGQNLFQPHHGEFNINPGPMVLIKRSVYAKIVWTR